jgi:hypothetical protein
VRGWPPPEFLGKRNVRRVVSLPRRQHSSTQLGSALIT